MQSVVCGYVSILSLSKLASVFCIISVNIMVLKSSIHHVLFAVIVHELSISNIIIVNKNRNYYYYFYFHFCLTSDTTSDYKFGVDSSSHFPFRVQTLTDTNNAKGKNTVDRQ